MDNSANVHMKVNTPNPRDIYLYTQSDADRLPYAL